MIVPFFIALLLWTSQVFCILSPEVKTASEKLHVCTVANRMHPNLEKLIVSCKEQGIELEILGMGEPYRRNTDKLRAMRKYCHRLPDDDLVLFVDAFDVLILADKQEIVSRFLELNVPMLMSMETNCWPSKETASYHPPTSSPFKYINTGGYIGWVKAVRSWLDAFDRRLLSGASDQEATHKLFKKKPYFYALDHGCAIFLCLYQVPSDALLIDPLAKKVTCTYTHSSPCVLHANGKSFSFWNEVYASFFEKPWKWHQEIQELVASNPLQLSIDEYTYLAKEIERKAPCNVLVFGLGQDSALWHQINSGGKTVFLEHNPKWYQQILSKHPYLNSHFIQYHTKLSDWKILLDQDPASLAIELPSEVMETPWDIIFVDGPEGYAPTNPGRMQSIYMASLLGQKGRSQILVHDCNRPAEQAYCSRFFTDARMIYSIEKLRHYTFEEK